MALDRTNTASNVPLPRDVTIEPGDRLDRYMVVEELGAGGMGVVYKAYDPDLERAVALKLVQSRPRRRNDVAAARMMREAQAIAQLSHPNVVSIFDVGVHGDDIFIAMELVPGRTLDEWMREPRTVAEILDVFEQAGQGLRAAHDKGIVHRDFKPGNVLVGDDGTVRVVDFGLARSLSDVTPEWDTPIDSDELPELAQTLTASGTVLGTPAYMAPEQRDAGVIDARADQYAFCVSLYEALTGQRPFSGRRAPAHEGEQAPPISRRHAPPWLDTVVRRGLAVDPSDRFSSMAELLGTIRRKRMPRGRRLAMYALIGVGCLLGAAGIGLAVADEQEPICRGFDEQLERVWNNQRRSQVERAFAATELAFAEPVWRETRRVLDTYATGWLSARVDTCRATHVRGEQSQELLDLKMPCLDRRLEELDELVTVLARADRELLARALQAATSLTPLDVCDDVDALMAEQPLPDDPERREQVRQVQAQIARAKAMFETGGFEQGEQALVGQVARARDVGHDATTAEALYWLGRYQSERDQRAAAIRSLEEAAVHADAGGADRFRLRVYIALLDLDDGERKSAERFEGYARVVRALLKRTGAMPLEQANLLEVEARRELARGNARKGLSRAEALREARLALLPPNHPAHISSLILLGRAHERSGYRARAAALLRDAEKSALALFGSEHPMLGKVWRRLSNAEARRGNLLAAERYARLAIDNALRFYGPNHSRVALGYHRLGNALVEQKRFDGALASYEQNLRIRKQIHGSEHRDVGTALVNMGYAYVRAGRYKLAEEYMRRGADMWHRTLGPAHPATAKGNVLLGLVFARTRDFERCARYNEAALVLFREHAPGHVERLNASRGFAACLFAMGRHRDALPELELAFGLSAEREESPKFRAQLEFLLAIGLWHTDTDRDRAMELAQSAHRRFVELGRAADVAEVADWLSASPKPAVYHLTH